MRLISSTSKPNQSNQPHHVIIHMHKNEIKVEADWWPKNQQTPKTLQQIRHSTLNSQCIKNLNLKKTEEGKIKAAILLTENHKMSSRSQHDLDLQKGTAFAGGSQSYLVYSIHPAKWFHFKKWGLINPAISRNPTLSFPPKIFFSFSSQTIIFLFSGSYKWRKTNSVPKSPDMHNGRFASIWMEVPVSDQWAMT